MCPKRANGRIPTIFHFCLILSYVHKFYLQFFFPIGGGDKIFSRDVVLWYEALVDHKNLGTDRTDEGYQLNQLPICQNNNRCQKLVMVDN